MTGFLILHVKLTWCLFVAKIFAGKSSYDSDTSSISIAASERVLVPGGYSDVPTSSIDQVETSKAVTDSQVCVYGRRWVHVDGRSCVDVVVFILSCCRLSRTVCLSSIYGRVSPLVLWDGDASEEEESTPLQDVAVIEKEEVRKRTIPPPGSGQRIYEKDSLLLGYREHLDYRSNQCLASPSLQPINEFDILTQTRDWLPLARALVALFAFCHSRFSYTKPAAEASSSDPDPSSSNDSIRDDPSPPPAAIPKALEACPTPQQRP
ncbi:hypothetical protein NL676_018018 [Syzygium grande]|nr:hypothetical protein NL676_018018 [Syzygium grande]